MLERNGGNISIHSVTTRSQAIETMNNGCEKDMLLLDYVKKQSPPPFLLKTYMLIEDPSTDDIISWNATGTAFVVWKTAEFSRDILPTLFKHSNFSSFVRQLNTYGFRKVTTSRWEFCNDMFRKGERDSLCNIRRRKAWETKFLQSAPIQTGQQEGDDDRGSSSTSSSSSYNSLLDENRRLKRENGVLSNELMCIKKKLNELLDLAMVYAKSEKMMEEEDERPKLFGVRLEVPGEKKRKRSTDIGEMIHVFSSHK